jgi:hypothetical protein
MVGGRKHSKYIPQAAVMTCAYVMSFVAFWWWRSGFGSSSDRVNLWVTRISLIANMPGWFPFSDGQVTPITRVLIPVINGTFWGLLGLLALKLVIASRGYLKSR